MSDQIEMGEVAPAAEETSMTEREARLKAIREKAGQLMREGRYVEARRVLKESDNIRKEEQKEQWLAEAKAEREKALELLGVGQIEEAAEALSRADKLEKQATDTLARTKKLAGSVRSLVSIRRRSKQAASDEVGEAGSEAVAPADPVAESMRIVGQHSKLAAAVGFLPGGLVNFVGIFAVQVPMVWRISRAFGRKEGREQVRAVLLSLVGSVIPGQLGQAAGGAVGTLTAAMAGTVFGIVATPVLAYALTRAVGSVFIMHFESGGTLLTFDPKAFTDYFLNEFRKAGGTVSEAEVSVPEAVATPA